ncbi:hypothetical protein ACFOGJ_26570, partial [Marinibaculum pumilum]
MADPNSLVTWTTEKDSYGVTATMYFGIAVEAAYTYYYDTNVYLDTGLIAWAYVGAIYTTDVLGGAMLNVNIANIGLSNTKASIALRGVDMGLTARSVSNNTTSTSAVLTQLKIFGGVNAEFATQIQTEAARLRINANRQDEEGAGGGEDEEDPGPERNASGNALEEDESELSDDEFGEEDESGAGEEEESGGDEEESGSGDEEESGGDEEESGSGDEEESGGDEEESGSGDEEESGGDEEESGSG